MHAAYKGKADMCKLLLQHGADVNCNEHEHGYTALMFAGLSGMMSISVSCEAFELVDLIKNLLCFCTSLPAGKTDITLMMLDAGAETDVVNSVGRTAAQMAAFVGGSVNQKSGLSTNFFYKNDTVKVILRWFPNVCSLLGP